MYLSYNSGAGIAIVATGLEVLSALNAFIPDAEDDFTCLSVRDNQGSEEDVLNILAVVCMIQMHDTIKQQL